MPYGAIGEAPRTRGGRRDGLHFWAGEVTLDGSNPTPVTTPFSAVKYAVATIKKTAAAAFGAASVSNINVDYGGAVAAGIVNLHAFNTLSAADPGEVASTNATVVVSVFAVGVY